MFATAHYTDSDFSSHPLVNLELLDEVNFSSGKPLGYFLSPIQFYLYPCNLKVCWK